MTLKTVIDPHGRKFKFGRKQSLAPGPRLSFGNYLLRKFPAPPPAADYTLAAQQYLRDIYGNSVCGDCTCAGIYHAKAVILANAGRPVPFVADDVINLYKLLSGWNGVEDDPSDTGLECPTVLNYAQSAYGGLPPDDDGIYAWLAIDGASQVEVAASINEFTCAYFGINMPQAWVDGMETLKDGDTWDVAGPGLPENGHSFMGAKYDHMGVYVDTWALDIRMTWAAVAKYATGDGEVFAVIDKEMINVASQKGPTGVNWTQMFSDFESVGLG